MQKFKNYLHKCREELKHIKHPTKKELYPRTIGVVAVSSAFALCFVLLDIVIKAVLFLFY